MMLEMHSMEGNRGRRAKSVRCISQVVFAPGRLLQLSLVGVGGIVCMFFGLYFISFCSPPLILAAEGSHFHMGGSDDACH